MGARRQPPVCLGANRVVVDAIIQSEDAADSASRYHHAGQWNAALRKQGGHGNFGYERRDA
jgi:hypothetical protein